MRTSTLPKSRTHCSSTPASPTPRWSACPSRLWGQVVCAAIVQRDPALTAEMLDRFCLDSPDLADFKRPRHYFFVDEIPANPTGKVERGKLKEQLMQKIGGRELD